MAPEGLDAYSLMDELRSIRPAAAGRTMQTSHPTDICIAKLCAFAPSWQLQKGGVDNHGQYRFWIGKSQSSRSHPCRIAANDAA